MENPSFIRDFPLPECISPCEQPSSVPMFREFRANCIHEQQLWHGMVHLLKADENQASGARQSPAASDTVGLEPKKPRWSPIKTSSSGNARRGSISTSPTCTKKAQLLDTSPHKNFYPASCGFISTGGQCSRGFPLRGLCSYTDPTWGSTT